MLLHYQLLLHITCVFWGSVAVNILTYNFEYCACSVPCMEEKVDAAGYFSPQMPKGKHVCSEGCKIKHLNQLFLVHQGE